MKRCYVCGTSKDLSEFYASKRAKDGRRSECKTCCKASAKSWAEKNPERLLNRVKAWTEANRARVDRNQAEYYRRNSASRKRDAKAWRAKNIEAATRNVFNWQSKNKSKVNEYKRTCYHKRRAWKLNSGGSFTAAQIADLFKLQRKKCAVCIASIEFGFHLDHITPLSKGGSNDIGNIQILCKGCNLRKSAADPIEFMQSRGFLL